MSSSWFWSPTGVANLLGMKLTPPSSRGAVRRRGDLVVAEGVPEGRDCFVAPLVTRKRGGLRDRSPLTQLRVGLGCAWPNTSQPSPPPGGEREGPEGPLGATVTSRAGRPPGRWETRNDHRGRLGAVETTSRCFFDRSCPPLPDVRGGGCRRSRRRPPGSAPAQPARVRSDDRGSSACRGDRVDRYIEEQLNPQAIPEPPELIRSLAALDTLRLDPAELFGVYWPHPGKDGVAPSVEEKRPGCNAPGSSSNRPPKPGSCGRR